MSLNKVMLIGNVGRDPEVRYLDGNNPAGGGNAKVATFTLATSERFTSRNGEQKENTEWHNIVAWRSLADLSEKFIRKGTQIYVEGRLRTREYTDQTGARKFRTEVVCDNIQLLGRRSDNPGAVDAAPQQGSYQRPAFGQQGYGAPQGGFQTPPAGYGAPQGFQPQGGFQTPPAAPAPAQAYSQPAPPAPEVIDISTDDPVDDLPF